MRHPDPPVQLRERLAVARRQGIPFDEAWEALLNGYRGNRIKFPHSTVERREWRAVLEEDRPVWEAAFHGEEVPGGAALARLFDALADDPGTRPTVQTIGHMPERCAIGSIEDDARAKTRAA